MRGHNAAISEVLAGLRDCAIIFFSPARRRRKALSFFLIKKRQKIKNQTKLPPTGKTPWPAVWFGPTLGIVVRRDGGIHGNVACCAAVHFPRGTNPEYSGLVPGCDAAISAILAVVQGMVRFE